MIVSDLNLVGVTVSPLEADAILIVDPNAVLPRTIAAQLL
jgi:hypothetical protein